jgi:NAD(P) transhydrogenase subunit alpha
MALIAVTRERRAGETRVAAVPETVKKLLAAGILGHGRDRRGRRRRLYLTPTTPRPARRSPRRSRTRSAKADIVFKVPQPRGPRDRRLKKGAIVAATLNPYQDKAALAALAKAGATAFAMEFIPRITRAQVMDVLSSQANLAGYRA